MICLSIFKKSGLLGFLLLRNITMAQNINFFGLYPTVNQTGRISKRVDYNLVFASVVDAFNEKIRGLEYPATDLLLSVQSSIIYTSSPNLRERKAPQSEPGNLEPV